MIRTPRRHMLHRAAIVARMREHDRVAGMYEIEAQTAGELVDELRRTAQRHRALADELAMVLTGNDKEGG